MGREKGEGKEAGGREGEGRGIPKMKILATPCVIPLGLIRTGAI